MTEETASWKRPQDVMLIRKKRRSIVSLSPGGNISRSPAAMSPGISPSTKSVKRRNPFSCQASKRPALLETSNTSPVTEPVKSESLLFKVLHSSGDTNSENEKKEEQSALVSDLHDESTVGTDQSQQNHTGQTKEAKQIELHDFCPIDWSLRSKVRFLSERPFSWCCQMSSSQECAGVTAFLKGTDSQINQELVGNAEAKAELKQAVCYWSHPNIPWLRLFPRITTDSKTGKPPAFVQEEKVQTSLMADWSESLTSAYQNLRSGYCPYFYLCCHHLTVLFRASGVAGHSDLHALVTPTSRGFRSALKAEGIEFSMPLNPHYKSSTPEDEEANEENENGATETSSKEELSDEKAEDDDADVEDEEMDDADDAASSWLHTLGLDANKFKSLDPKKIKLQRECFKLIDQRPESAVLVEGGDVQALFNYLLNTPSLVSPTGWQASVPPTILAPTCFKGATLKCLQMKSGLVRQGTGEQHAYSFEVVGPIMPLCLDSLLKLFTHTQHSYTASFSVHEPTTPFNACSITDTVNPPSLSAALPHSHLTHIVKNYGLGKTALREISYQSGKYSWTS